MQPNENKPDIVHLKWAITQRANIQHTLLALYAIAREASLEENLHHLDIFIETYLFDHLIAAAFSLWRAVFLADIDRSVDITLKHQEQFLEKLITTNSIAFSDDYSSRAWTVTFYLEAAKGRLSTALRIVDNPFNQIDKDTLLEIESLLNLGGRQPAYTRYEWEALHRALRILMKLIYPIVLLQIESISHPDA